MLGSFKGFVEVPSLSTTFVYIQEIALAYLIGVNYNSEVINSQIKSETDLKREIGHLLDLYGVLWRRLNSGRTRVRGGWMRHCPAGTADLVAFPVRKQVPLVLWIETKKPKETQSPDQVKFQADVESRGMSYIVARSLDDVTDWLRAAQCS